jgi:hypothetical protein
MNWQQHDGVEALVGSRGTKQGKKCATNADYHKQASRLCRRELHILAAATIGGRGDLALPSMALRQAGKTQCLIRVHCRDGSVAPDDYIERVARCGRYVIVAHTHHCVSPFFVIWYWCSVLFVLGGHRLWSWIPSDMDMFTM